MSDDLIKRLRASRVVWQGGKSYPTDAETAAADRIEELVKERDEALASQSYNYISKDMKPILARDLEDAKDAAEAKFAKAVEALRKLVRLDDDYSPWGGELLRDRVVRTWEEARAVLAELEKQ